MAAPFHDLRGGGSPFMSIGGAHSWALAKAIQDPRWRPRVALRQIRREFGEPVTRWVVTLHEQA